MEIKFQVTGRKLKRKMFMEQFSLVPRMVEIVTVTHKLLISICPVLFSGLRALEEQGLSLEACPEVLWPPGDGQQFSPAPAQAASAFWRGSVLPRQSQGAFIWTL